MTHHADHPHTSADAIHTMAMKAMDLMPPEIRALTTGVSIRVADWPSADLLHDLNIPHRSELTGMYQGIPLPEKSATFPQTFPDTVWLFRKPILIEWEERGNVTLEALVQNVTIHEFAHHFGWSDDQIAAIDPWWE